MSRLVQRGFETRVIASEFASVLATPSLNTSVVHSGSASMEISGSLAADAVEGVGHTISATQTKVYQRWYFNVVSLPSDGGASVLFFDFLTGTTNVVSVQVYYNGTNLTGTVYVNNFGSNFGSFNCGYNDDWHYIEIEYDSTPANGSEVCTVRLDGSQVAQATNLNYTNKTINAIQAGVYNGTGSAITPTVYLDDFAINNSSGSVNNSWCGAGKIVIASPSAAGDNNPTAGDYSSVNEIPWTNTATSSANRIELDSNGDVAYFNVPDSSSLGIDSYDTITAVELIARMRTEASGAANYQLRIKSASGGTVTNGSSPLAGNTTTRTNPSNTTNFGSPFVVETDPTTGVAWTPTGTNSIDNMQIGIANVDEDSTPDIWVTAFSALIEYVEGSVSENSERGLYTKGKASTNSERGLYTIGSVLTNSEKSLYTWGTTTANSERGLYVEGSESANSERGLYTTGQVLENSERGLYTKGQDSTNSERGLYTTGSTLANSERGLYTKGAASTESERGLYTAGKASTDSERGLYTIGSIADTSERGLYTEGATGATDTDSERGLYTVGKALDNSERGLYTAGFDNSFSERELYTSGKSSDSSEHNLYAVGSEDASSERGLYTEGSVSENSERGLYTSGTDTTNSERNLYTTGSINETSERGLYTEGSISEGSERNLYTTGVDTAQDERGLYTIGKAAEASERSLYTSGAVEPESSERGLYTAGVYSDSSERGLYTNAVHVDSSERGLYTISNAEDYSERGLYTVGQASDSSERSLYTSSIQRLELDLSDDIITHEFFSKRLNDLEVFWKKVLEIQSLFYKVVSNTSLWNAFINAISTWIKEQDSESTWVKEEDQADTTWGKTTVGRTTMFAYENLLTEDREITDSVIVYILEDHFGTEGFGTDIIGKEHITS